MWYGAHSQTNCRFVSTEIITDNEEISPDFIEIKQEEIIDMEEEIFEENDIFSENISTETDTAIELDEDSSSKINEISSDDELEIIRTKSYTYSLESLKDAEKSFVKEMIGGNETSTSLTKEQLCSRTCPICEKIIVNKQNLICHMNIHKGVKPFVCSVCEKSFAHIRNLFRHKEQQGHCEMDYTCKFRGCKKKFMTSNKLNRHIKLHHLKYAVDFNVERPKPYKCTLCAKSFTTERYLSLHQERHNN